LKSRVWAYVAAGATVVVLAGMSVAQTDATPQVMALTLHHLHTNETATIVFKRNGVYDQAGLQKLNYFLRDWRQEKPTDMDPHLFDLLWEVYKQSGSHAVIQVVCGYRAPVTNAMLRRRSTGVAENSLHMQGKAMDFFIPDVPLEKLREIGLRLQAGGVGFYPTSGSPFVHMDTGSVRHWPRMTRQQLVRVFPDGKTLDIPTDGKPLPGYNEALAEYNAKKASGQPIAMFADASFKPGPFGVPAPAAPPVMVADASAPSKPAAPTPTKTAIGAPIQLAAIDPDEADDESDDSTGLAQVIASADVVPPLPHLAPRHATIADAALRLAAAFDASGPAAPAVPAAPSQPTILASADGSSGTLVSGYLSPDNWSAAPVPSALARALANRSAGNAGSGTSVPIAPTAVVATIDVNRPLRAEAITTAVMRDGAEPMPTVSTMLAYADDTGAVAKPRIATASAVTGIPLPSLRPHTDGMHTASIHPNTELPAMPEPQLTLTTLDTQGLRTWIAPQSTRQQAYALLTMPDFANAPELFEKPVVTYGAGFGQVAYQDLRTDRFSGALVEQPAMIDLEAQPLIASVR
jgi:uncharacterized protein YcbK (DUF882 family)